MAESGEKISDDMVFTIFKIGCFLWSGTLALAVLVTALIVWLIMSPIGPCTAKCVNP